MLADIQRLQWAIKESPSIRKEYHLDYQLKIRDLVALPSGCDILIQTTIPRKNQKFFLETQ